FDTGNIQLTTANPTTLTLNGLQDGAQYTLILAGSIGGTYHVSASGYTVYGAAIDHIAATKTIVNLVVQGTNLFVTSQPPPSLKQFAARLNCAPSTTFVGPYVGFNGTPIRSTQGSCELYFASTQAQAPICTCSAASQNMKCMVTSISEDYVGI